MNYIDAIAACERLKVDTTKALVEFARAGTVYYHEGAEVLVLSDEFAIEDVLCSIMLAYPMEEHYIDVTSAEGDEQWYPVRVTLEGKTAVRIRLFQVGKRTVAVYRLEGK